MWIVALLIVVGLLAALFISPRRIRNLRSPQKGRIEFFSKGMDSGFSISEVRLLWAASVQARLERPSAIFGSIDELDRAINEIAGSEKFGERKVGEPETRILKKLFDYRKKIEMERHKYKNGLRNTRDIAVGQHLTIRVDGLGIYLSKVVENDPGFITITVPSGETVPDGFSWRQSLLNVYFWRNEDAGYFFQTRILKGIYGRKKEHFRIQHSDTILRSQKRRSVRSPAKIPARFFLLQSLEEATRWMESRPGLSCLITDLSEDGAALRIGGRGRKNRPFKIQFKIRGEMVVVLGMIRKVVYNSKQDESTLHAGFLSLSENIRMIILAYVFDIDRSRVRNDSENETMRLLAGLKAESSDDDLDYENTGDEKPAEEDAGQTPEEYGFDMAPPAR